MKEEIELEFFPYEKLSYYIWQYLKSANHLLKII